MKIFIDSADPKQIREAWDLGIIDGVTTNPSLAAKVGKPYTEIVDEILEIVSGPVSLETIAIDADGIIREAERLASIGENVVVKIPCIQDGFKAAKFLSSKNIKTNMTLCFSESQAILSARAGATYVSPFVGRIDDVSEHAGEELVENIRDIYDEFGFETQVLAASVRDVEHFELVAHIGADAVTLPYEVLMKLHEHPLTTQGLERFLSDWNKSGLELP